MNLLLLLPLLFVKANEELHFQLQGHVMLNDILPVCVVFVVVVVVFCFLFFF